MQTRPRKGKGERFLECRSYESCLDFAAIQNWHQFRCNDCPFYISIFKKTKAGNEVKKMPSIPEAKENTRICRECGKKPTIQPSSPLCGSCIAKQAWKDGKRVKKKAQKAAKDEKGTQDKAKPQNPQEGLNSALTIEFGKHVSVLREIEKVAEDEIRSVDEQVVYILKNYLSNTQAPRSD